MKHNCSDRTAGWAICIILLASGGLKLVDGMGTVKALDIQHPILFLTYRQVELLVSFTELLLGGWCIASRNSVRSACAVVGYSLCLICYKVVQGYVNPNEPCHCLGVLLGWLPWLKAVEGQVTWTLVVVLLLLSAYRLFCLAVFSHGAPERNVL